LEDLPDLIVGCKTTFACSLQASIDTFKFFRCCVIRARAEACVNLKRYLCEFDLSSFRPILDAPQCILQNLGSHVVQYSMVFVYLKSGWVFMA